VVWYLTPDQPQLGDGGFLDYLLPEAEDEYRPCDPELFASLRALVMSGARSVAGVRIREILPPGTIYYESLLAYAGAARGRRLAMREQWLDQALIATAPADIVFLDPDNGLRTRPLEGKPEELKSVHLDELRPYLARGQSCVVYHHLGRTRTHDVEMSDWRETLQEGLGLDTPPFALRFARRSPRVFFVIPAAAHRTELAARLGRFLDGPWGRLFPPNEALGL